MGIMDKAKFWKKESDDDFGDLSDLGDFGLDNAPGAGTPAPAPGDSLDGGLEGGFDSGMDTGMGDLPSFDEPLKPGMRSGVPTHMEEVQPTQASRDLGDQFGLTPASPQQQRPASTAPTGRPAYSPQPQQQQTAPQQQQYAPQYNQGQGSDLGDLAKDMEIVHAKLDAIRSSLDSINQRLATLERIASGDSGNSNRQRYNW